MADAGKGALLAALGCLAVGACGGDDRPPLPLGVTTRDVARAGAAGAPSGEVAGAGEASCAGEVTSRCSLAGDRLEVVDACGKLLREEPCPHGCTAGECHVTATCPNGVLDAGEECDGEALGGASCESLGHEPGVLRCASNCEYDTRGCGDCALGVARACVGSNVYELDACGNRGRLLLSCACGCEDARCLPSYKERTTCEDGWETLFDRCGEEVTTRECYSNTCDNDRCLKCFENGCGDAKQRSGLGCDRGDVVRCGFAGGCSTIERRVEECEMGCTDGKCRVCRPQQERIEGCVTEASYCQPGARLSICGKDGQWADYGPCMAPFRYHGYGFPACSADDLCLTLDAGGSDSTFSAFVERSDDAPFETDVAVRFFNPQGSGEQSFDCGGAGLSTLAFELDPALLGAEFGKDVPVQAELSPCDESARLQTGVTAGSQCAP